MSRRKIYRKCTDCIKVKIGLVATGIMIGAVGMYFLKKADRSKEDAESTHSPKTVDEKNVKELKNVNDIKDRIRVPENSSMSKEKFLKEFERELKRRQKEKSINKGSS